MGSLPIWKYTDAQAGDCFLSVLKALWQRNNVTGVTLSVLVETSNTKLANSDVVLEDANAFFVSGLKCLVQARKIVIGGVGEITKDFQTQWDMEVAPGSALHYVHGALEQQVR
jgi:hypothetical protein